MSAPASPASSPGPSTMTTSSGSPIVPALAKKLRMKRRIVNLINPADPDDFSIESTPAEYPEHMPEEEHAIPFAQPRELSVEMEREQTPSPKNLRVMELRPTPASGSSTPMSDSGVKGILRSAGTPGSGNGVRFFPKNRFRVITPNPTSMPTPSKPTPQAPPATPPSFFSQLLAVSFTSSPKTVSRESTMAPPATPDESWEVPGQEGEVSLVDISAASFNEVDLYDDEGVVEEEVEEGVEEEPWSGQPEIISSPLGLPAEKCSTDVSQEISLPSLEWKFKLPADDSNILSARLSPPLGDSFTISDMPTPIVNVSADVDKSGSSEVALGADDSNPTIRRSLPPVEDVSLDLPNRSVSTSLRDTSTHTPADSPAPRLLSPAPTRPFTTIFADMSAEQAELSWPLAPTINQHLSTDTPTRSQVVASPSKTPRSVGNATEYFDCDSMVLSPLSPVLGQHYTPSPTPSPLQTPSPSQQLISTPSSAVSLKPGQHPLALPTQALFAAHSEQTEALAAELELYRSLAQRLQAEVAERDAALADLNLRAVETEMLRAQLETQQRSMLSRSELKSSLSSRSPPLHASPSPFVPETPSPLSKIDHAGDRTTVVQAETRDLEIRLAKALADHGELAKAFDDGQRAREADRAEMERLRDAVKAVEKREQNQAIVLKKREVEFQAQLDDAEAQFQAQFDEAQVQYQAQLEEAQAQLDDAHARLETNTTAGADVQQVQSELESTQVHLDGVQAQLDDIRAQLDDALAELSTERDRADSLESQLEDVKGNQADTQEEIERLNTEVQAGEEWKKHAEDLEAEVEAKNARLDEMENLVVEEREARAQLQAKADELVAKMRKEAKTSHNDKSLQDEITRLRKESALKDLEIVTLQKRKAELKEDKEMLNIALDSKQQELELTKRKFGVRGVAGSTPLGSTDRANFTDLATPAPYKGQTPSTSIRPRRVPSTAIKVTSSTNAAPPSAGPRPSAFETPQLDSARRTYGRRDYAALALSQTTVPKNRVMSRVDEENRQPRVDSEEKEESVALGSRRTSLRQQRVMMPA